MSSLLGSGVTYLRGTAHVSSSGPIPDWDNYIQHESWIFKRIKVSIIETVKLKNAGAQSTSMSKSTLDVHLFPNLALLLWPSVLLLVRTTPVRSIVHFGVAATAAALVCRVKLLCDIRI